MQAVGDGILERRRSDGLGRRLGYNPHAESVCDKRIVACQIAVELPTRCVGCDGVGAIGDPAALPSLDKALLNYDEPDNVRDAYTEAKEKLEAIKAGRPVPTPEAAKPKKKRKKAALKPGQEPAMPAAVASPKISEQK